MTQKQVKMIGYLGSALSVLMYVSYIVQIIDNLHGNKGNIVQPFAALCNCIVWTVYGFLIQPKQWPVIIANVPGIVLAFITIITAL